MSSRKQAIDLLKSGCSYSEISSKLNIAKSTLNSWFKKLSDKEKKKIKSYRIKNWKKSYLSYANKKKVKTKQEEQKLQQKAASSIKKITKRELFLIGSALYWAEGAKTNRWGLQFSNSDPEMILLIMKFFRQVCRVGEKRFYMQLILHPNIDAKEAINYWSKLTNVSKIQFKKPCYSLSKSSKKRRKKRQLPYGTLQVRIHDKSLTHKVYGYIKGLKQAGVVQQ